ncbi:MAG TPA: hypothetical protein V6C84_28505 [Coleofasciculaceae cyanobacterium]|jgi:Arc/MetJ-type ribon-helix-helix transcriptional regulator
MANTPTVTLRLDSNNSEFIRAIATERFSGNTSSAIRYCIQLAQRNEETAKAHQADAEALAAGYARLDALLDALASR